MNKRGDRPKAGRLPGSYWRLWLASSISNLGDGVFAVALPLMAAQMTDSPLAIGLIAVFFSIPWLLFSLPVGVIIDRSDRRNVLVIADMSRGLLVGGFAVVVALADVQMWMLWVLAFGLGLGEVFFDNSAQTILPMVVPHAELERANGYFYATEVANNTFIGMPLGSLLFGLLLWLPFGLDAASFAIAALLAMMLPGTFRTTGNGSGTTGVSPAKVSVGADVRIGLRWLRSNTLLRNLALGVALMNLAFAATQATFVLFVTRDLGISNGLFGPVLAVVGAGSLLAGLLGGWAVSKIGRRTAMLVAGFTPVLTTAAIGFWPTTWWVVAMTTIQALMTTVWSIVAVSLRQQIVPDHLFGRVNSVYRWVSVGVMPIGALLGGLVAGRFNLRAPYFLASGVLLLAALLVTSRLTTSAIASATKAAADSAMPASQDSDGPLADSMPDDADETPLLLERGHIEDLL